MKEDAIFTYQTRIDSSGGKEDTLSATAEHLCRVERCLFADYAKGKNLLLLKADYLQKHKITARQFNALRTVLEGKIRSIITLREVHILRTQSLIEKVTNKLLHLQKNKDKPLVLRKKNQQLQRLQNKLKALLEDKNLGKVRLCFGSQRLFHAQFHLKENGYSSHEEWKKDWHKSRNNSFFALGSKDETSGNQTCQATVCEDGTLTLKLRLPDSLKEEHGKYLILEKVYFAYGHEVIIAALKSCKKRQELKEKKDSSYKRYGQAISYRFKLGDNKKWYVFASTAREGAPICTHKEGGAVGIDINADHIAMVEIDAQGNPLHKESFPLYVYGKSSEQAEALIGNAVAVVVSHAKEVQKPIVIEELDFTKKKQDLADNYSPSYARTLSSFVYSKIITNIKSTGYRSGVEVLSVNPAFTSVMGRIKYAVRRGLTVHESAALCIARRGLGLSEKVPCHLNKIPDGRGGYVSLTLPARTRGKHKWSIIRQISKKLSAELAAHFRAIRKGSIHKAVYPKYRPA